MPIRRLRSRQAIADELGSVLEASRRFFERGQTQAEIGRAMEVSQSTVSRWLRRAEADAIVQMKVRTPYVVQLQSELRERLPSSFRDCRIVPSGSGKNVENLGDAGAEMLVQAILDVQNRKQKEGIRPADLRIGVTVSSGVTLRKVAEQFVERIGQDVALRNRLVAHLDFRPAAVFSEVEIRDFYPTTLVTTLWTQLTPLLGDRVHAFAPMLPASYYANELWREEGPAKERALHEGGAAGTIEAAAKADVFVLGIGTLDDPIYASILRATHADPAQVIAGGDGRAELVYAPFRDDRGVERRIVRVNLDTLRDAAADSRRWCIGVSGGRQKVEAVTEILSARPPVLNCLVGCADVAEFFLRSMQS
jgi:DNA-binding transcriptional regulator LsrR (DeoR family)